MLDMQLYAADPRPEGIPENWPLPFKPVDSLSELPLLSAEPVPSAVSTMRRLSLKCQETVEPLLQRVPHLGMRRAVRRVCGKLRGRCHINALPIELLSFIFELAQDAYRQNFHDDETNVYDPCFCRRKEFNHHRFSCKNRMAFSLTRVCVYWREAALDTATLWTDIDLQFRGSGVEYFARAKGARVRLVMPDVPIPQTQVVQAEAAEKALTPESFTRICSLEWHARPGHGALINLDTEKFPVHGIRRLKLSAV